MHTTYQDDTPLKQRKAWLRSKTDSHTIDLQQEIIKRIPLETCTSILDIGCGNADLLCKIRKAGFGGKLVGIDNSDGMIASARNNTGGLAITIIKADAKHLPFPDASFDAIIMSHTLHAIDKPELAMNEAWQCLCSGGLLVLSVHDNNDRPKLTEFLRLAGKALNAVTKREENIARINMDTIQKYLQAFTVIDSVRFESPTTTTSAEMYVSYFNSYQQDFSPTPDDDAWATVVAEIKNKVLEEIKESGQFTDVNRLGIVVGKKS